MKDFSIKEAAFAGFRLVAKHPGLLAVLGLLNIITTTGIAVFAVASGTGKALTGMSAAQASGAPDPAMSLSLLVDALPLFGLQLLVSLGVIVIFMGAVNRAVIWPEKSRFPFVAFGGDELRLSMVTLLLGLIFTGLLVLGSLLVGIVGLIAVLVRGAPSGGPSSAIVAVNIGAVLLLYVTLGLLGVRFTLAAPQTVRERAVRVFGSWGLIRRRYWRTVGAYLLGCVATLPLAVLAIGLVAGAAATTPDFAAAMLGLTQPDYSTMATAFTPLMLTYFIAAGAYGALLQIVLLATGATIYDQVTYAEEAAVF